MVAKIMFLHYITNWFRVYAVQFRSHKDHCGTSQHRCAFNEVAGPTEISKIASNPGFLQSHQLSVEDALA